MEQAVLNRKECEALSEFINKLTVDFDGVISDDLESAAAKIEAVVTSPGE